MAKRRQVPMVNSAQHLAEVARFTVGQSYGFPLFIEVQETGHAPSRGIATVGSAGTVGQRHKRDRMRHGRARTMRQQRVRMPLP